MSSTDPVHPEQDPAARVDQPENASDQPVTPLPAAFFAANRRRLLDRLGDCAITLIAAGRPPHRTADEHYPFLANRNFFYLSGIEQEDAVLLLCRTGDLRRELLFLPAQDPMHERWRGHRLSPAEARGPSGIDTIEPPDALDQFLHDLLADPSVRIWLDGSAADAQNTALREKIRSQWPEQSTDDLAPHLTRLRMIKSDEEVARMRAAIALTDRGIRAMLRRLRPGLREYHLWSEFARTLADEGCLTPAFASIVAAGRNVFCLHYMQPFALIQPGDLVQIDVGAISAGLCADISRILPANGRFTAAERVVYDVVRRCQETAFATIKPGATLAEVNEACRTVAREGLLAAGLMQPDEAVTDHFWHNVSHHLGFDVHDVADREAVFEPGMVLTVEPGIYLPAHSIGMRIEDDVLVTADGCEVLSQAVPREADEIEALMTALDA